MEARGGGEGGGGRRQHGWRPLPQGGANHFGALLLPRRFACATVVGGRRQRGWRRRPLWRPKNDHFLDKFFQGSICEISFLKGPKCEKSRICQWDAVPSHKQKRVFYFTVHKLTLQKTGITCEINVSHDTMPDCNCSLSKTGFNLSTSMLHA